MSRPTLSPSRHRSRPSDPGVRTFRRRTASVVRDATVDLRSRLGVPALDVRLELACLDPPLTAAAHLNRGELSGPHESVSLRARDVEHLGDCLLYTSPSPRT